VGDDPGVIRNVCIHIANEQPLLADLFEIPTSGDAGLVCTNLRGMDGKRPIFIDRIESTFFFPYRAVRFLEIPAGELERHRAEVGSAPAVGHSSLRHESSAGSAPLEPEQRLPVPVVTLDDGRPEGDLDTDLEIDEDFLQRIRDI
jgi:hypothetical protein